MNRICTIKEISELLNIKQKTIYTWAELGKIPSIKLNGSIRFDIGDIEQWIRDCKRKADSCHNPFAQTTKGPGKEERR